MSSGILRIFKALTPALLVAACSPDLRLADTVVVTCASDDDCLDGSTCTENGRCVTAGRIDTVGPALSVPANNAVVRESEPVFFAWKAVEQASRYTLTLHADGDPTPVAGTPLAVTDTQTSIALSAGTYRWSITSDVSQSSSAENLFAVVGSTLYVYCTDSAATCDAGEDELGTIGKPFRSIQRGIIAAAALGGVAVQVARRGHDVAYAEAIELFSGVDVAGGYDSTFASAGEPTVVAIDGAVLVASRITLPTRFDGFALTNTSAPGVSSTVVRIFECTRELTLANVHATTHALTTPVVQIQDGRDMTGPLILSSIITGDYGAGRTDVLSDVAAVDARAAVRLDGVLVVANAGSGVGIITGVSLFAEHQELFDVSISRSSVVVEGSSSSGTSQAIQALGLNVLSIEASQLAARYGDYVYGLYLNGAASARLAGNIIEVSDAPNQAFGVSPNSAAVQLVNNTFVLANTGNAAYAVYGSDVAITVVNNVFIAAGSHPACTAASPCRVALYESGSSATIPGLVRNAVTGFDCPLRRNAETCQAFPPPDSTNPPNFGNLQPTLAELGLPDIAGADGLYATLDDALHPIGGVLLHAGHDTSLCDCEATCNPTAPANCGGAIADADSTGARPEPPTIGALEP